MRIHLRNFLLAGLFLFSFCSDSFAQKHFLKNFSLQTAGTNSTLPPSNSISQLLFYNSKLWIGTSSGLASSTDLGRSWVNFRSNPAFANDGIFAIAVSGDTIWAATGYDKQISDGTVQTGSGYANSLDGGTTWHHISQVMDARGDSIVQYGINDTVWVLPVLVPEQNVTFDVSIADNVVWTASWAGGLRKSTNNGQTWQRVLLPPDYLKAISPLTQLWTYGAKDTLLLHPIYPHFDPRDNNNFLAFSVYAQDSDTIWCGTAGGINRSTDGGSSWVRFTHQNELKPILGNWVIAVGLQTIGSTHRVWTTNWKADDPNEMYGVSYTDDGGLTWTNVLPGVKAYKFAFKDSIAYIAGDDGIFRTSDGGLSFSRFSTISDPSSHNILSNVSIYTVDVYHDTVFVGTADGLASTIDNATNVFGSTWKIYRTYEQVGTANKTYAYPNPFSPAVEQVRIHYGASSTSAGTRTVTIDIFDFGMNRVRTLINDAPRDKNREFDEIWNGKTDGGDVVANGVYIYRVKSDDQDAIYGKILVIQ